MTIKTILGLCIFIFPLSLFSLTYHWEKIQLIPHPVYMEKGKPLQTVMVGGISGLKSDANYVVVAAAGGVFLSQDGGKTMLDISESFKNNFNKRVDVISKNNIVVGKNNGLYITHNGGKSWSRAPIGGKYGPWLVTGIAHTRNSIYVASKSGLYFSRDLGEHWEKPKCNWTFCSADTFHFYIKNPHDIYLGSKRDGVFRSTDEGITWSLIAPGQYNDYLVTKKYIFMSADVDGFERINRATKKRDFIFKNQKDFRSYGLAKTNDNTLYVGDDEGDIFQSLDGGLHWHQIAKHLIKDGTVNVIYAPTKNVIYVGIQPHGLWKGTLVTQHKK